MFTFEYRPGQNAIRSLNKGSTTSMSQASRTSSSYDSPSVGDIPPVALTNIMIVQRGEFDSYMSRFNSIYQDLERLKDNERDHVSLNSEKVLKPGQEASVLPSKSLSSQPQPTRRENITRDRQSSISLPRLSTIPAIYSQEDFHLENPRVFDIVSERAYIIPPGPSPTTGVGDTPMPRKALATNAILQEKLSWYMDTVEVHLDNSISQASASFCSALSSLKELHSKVAESVDMVHMVRQDLKSLDEEVVTQGLGLLNRRRQEHNLQQLNNALRQLQHIVDGVAHCESLTDSGEVEQALDEIDSIELTLAGHPAPLWQYKTSADTPLQDMCNVIALQGIYDDLSMLRTNIGKVYTSKVHSLLIGDLRGHAESTSAQESLKRWNSTLFRARRSHGREPSSLPVYMTVSDKLRSILGSHMSGLYRSNSISTAIGSYKGLVSREILDIVRRALPSSSEDNDSIISGSSQGGSHRLSKQKKSSVLARNIRDLDAQSAEILLITVYVGISETLRRLKTQSGLLQETASIIGDPDFQISHNPSSIRSPVNIPKPTGNTSVFEIQSEIFNAFDLPGLLGQMIELSHEKISKILRVRSQQVVALPLTHFLRYFTLNLLFTNECEAISGHTSTLLGSIINNHVKDFIISHRDREIQALAQGMSDDDWQDGDFTIQHNEILEQILQCSMSDPPAWIEATNVWLPLAPDDPEGSEDVKSSKLKDNNQVATIEQESFLLPHSAMLCLRGISYFLRLISGIPSMTHDITVSLISYLQTFDSRCRQLVLGAGAMRSAGLKKITTKHLALASQALSFIKTLVVYIRGFVQRIAPTNVNAIGEFEKVRRSLQEHQDAIYQKIIEIMESRALSLSQKAREINWDCESVGNKRKYISDLATDTTKLYKALDKYLPKQLVESLMSSIFASYKTYLGNAFQEVNLQTETGRNCLLQDVEYLLIKLDKCKGFSDLGIYLIDIIKAK